MKIDLTKFEIPNIDAWKNQVLKEANDNDALLYKNEIENLNIDISSKHENQKTFSSLSAKCDWDIISSFNIGDSFENNELIIKCLEHGSNHIFLDIRINKPDWDIIFKDIVIEIVHVTVAFHNEEQLNSFKTFLPKENEQYFTICIDPFELNYFQEFKDSSVSYCVNGFALEQIGASTNQQLASMIYCAERLLQYCKNPNRVKFKMGIGSDFLIESGKIRALKWLWQHLLSKNDYMQSQVYIMGSTGWTNKSLKDPHTNLLRQTTEALAAVSGGVSGLLIHSASELTEAGSTWFDIRMALNISHILKEESFLSKVHDPLQGSYVSELLTEQIIDNSWNLFLELHDNLAQENKAEMSDNIKLIRNQKEQNFKSGKKQLIGINLFHNKDEQIQKWEYIPDYLEMSYLIYETLEANE